MLVVLLLLSSDVAFAWNTDTQYQGFRLYMGDLRKGIADSRATKYEHFKAYVYLTITSTDIRGDTTVNVSAYGVVNGVSPLSANPKGGSLRAHTPTTTNALLLEQTRYNTSANTTRIDIDASSVGRRLKNRALCSVVVTVKLPLRLTLATLTHELDPTNARC